MQERFVRAFLGAALMLVVGCGASGPPFQPLHVPEGKSVIYAYRPSSLFGAAIRPTVMCGATGQVLSRGGYHPFVVEPGTVMCSAATEATSEVEVEATAGQEHYVKEEIGWGFFVGRPHLYLMDATEGRTEITECVLEEGE